MGVLADRVAAQVRALQAEKRRIGDQYVRDLAAVDVKLEALGDVANVITDDVEKAVAVAVKLGLIPDIAK